MQRASLDEMNCSVARTLEVVGDRWTPLIVRDISLGITRFDVMQRNLGISRKVLSGRLAALREHGVVERAAYQDNPVRYDYRLTEKGVDLAMVLLAMKAWGDRWVFGETEAPMPFRHDRCGLVTNPIATCSGCGEPLLPGELTPLLAPGYTPGPGTSEIPAALARTATA